MALDEPSDKDLHYTVDDLNFIIGDIDDAIIKRYGGVAIDYTNYYGYERLAVFVARGMRC
ncbi:MAG: hypothetical protein CL920_13250 [Deltaproteobacteria bacterium]|nr:hypothetical protein [Deltaproteobacteria bacterium]MBU49656.1 hypothetical protein [Deltaproteobacteria bacterium]|tara:strand:+ start:2486 stop:2665 length:180 start_codon:yes stop_codon:yes gene_type:complete